MSRSITELSNPLTRSIDAVDPTGILRLLRQSDAQLFAGWETFPSLMDEDVLESLARAAWRMARLLRAPDSIVVMAGAGTSGRLAYLLCLEFNRILKERRLPEVFRPLMAGGEAALIMAQEAAEDSATAAQRDIKDAVHDSIRQGMYIGITCGLSAPYVAAQLEMMGGNSRFESVLVGFNPAYMARATSTEGWDKTVKEIVDRALESERFTLINPVYGPEPITGSTRMKGGSATKIALETVFATALWIVENETGPESARVELSGENLLPLRRQVAGQLRRYRQAVEAAYGNIPALAELVRLAGTALRSSGRIHYLGRGVAGLLGIIDASECPPTFGSDLYDVRGYLREGWEMLGYSPAAMRARGRAYEIDLEYFAQSVLPDVTKGDLVIAVAVGMPGEMTLRLLNEAAQAKARTALLLIATEPPKPGVLPDSIGHRCVVIVPSLGFAPGVNNEAELALKICLNATTTGAHIMAGKIYENIMIDLRISNSKLHARAIGLIARLLTIPEAQASRALHYAIFKSLPDDAKLADASVAVAVQRAVTRSRIVPLAMLLATGKFTYDEAEERLASEPRVRRIVEDILGQTQA